MQFTDKQTAALARIVEQWVDEGFTSPPYYTDEQYDIFEMLEIESTQYNIARPQS